MINGLVSLQTHENFFHRKDAKDAKDFIFHKIGEADFMIPRRDSRLRRIEVREAMSGLPLAPRLRRDANGEKEPLRS